MADKNPQQRVKDAFGDKAKLVAEVEKFTSDDLWVARTNQNKGLAHVSNAKLLRLHKIFTDVKARFGTRQKLIEAILELTKRVKDDGYKSALASYPVPRLYDLFTSTEKRVKGSQARTKDGAAKDGAPKKAAAAPKKAAEAKAAPAKKTAAKKAPAKKG